MNPTAKQIADATYHLQGRANRTAIFAAYRAQDDSDSWPVDGRFNVTERAIRRLRKFERDSSGPMYGLELCHWLEGDMSRIVNAP